MDKRRWPEPAGILPLLWRTAERPSRTTGLTIDKIVNAAVAIADADGLDAATMRGVAERLGVGTMSLYTHVPGKRELYALMLDHVFADAADERPADRTPEESWRIRLTAIARQDRARYLRHPWLLDLPVARPAFGPKVTAKYDRDLAALDGTGLNAAEMNATIMSVTSFVYGAARFLSQARSNEHAGQTEGRFWQDHRPYFHLILDPARFPTASRVAEETGQAEDWEADHERSFEFGLDRLLAGVHDLIDRRART